MYFLAAAVTKGPSGLRDITPEFWMKIGLAVLGLIVVIVVLRKLAKVNKVVLAIGTLLVLSIVGFNWIYERNEPAWATPAVKWLANYFPTKDAIAAPPGSGVK
jgi:hypothetical protein